MKRITANQELEVGKRYYCRSKLTGTIVVEEVFFECGMRYVGKNRIWAFDEKDKHLTNEVRERIAAATLDAPYTINPDTDYYVNSQALARWDIIGPIFEPSAGFIQGLFDLPGLIKEVERSILIHADGDVVLQTDQGNNNESPADYFIIDKTILDCYLPQPERFKTVIDCLRNSQESVEECNSFVITKFDSLIGKKVAMCKCVHSQTKFIPAGAVVEITSLINGGISSETTFTVKDIRGETFSGILFDSFNILD